ncbi:hypothetical protein GCM10010389_30320 [Streptomyces echinoruber]|uniref:Integrase catalytic domain-containing protein n=1 Tax=Streptomyces echinoruber TaxID=68898 RepID=A0A918R967_9ACTN|nr:hypothetical protein GCM10010389_30320 [Streptomyces echinoruber]
MVNRFQFVHDHRDAFGVKRLCQVLGVNRSGCYRWRDGAEARIARLAADRALAEQIRAVHADSGGACGSLRITAELRADGRKINGKRVARVMREFSIQGVRLRGRVRTTIPEPSATPVPDLFQRDFTAPAPKVKYLGDITHLPTGNGQFLCLATVLDCFSRRVVGWSLAAHMRTELVADALRMAAATRGGLSGAVFHPDHGAQYTSREFAALCGELGVTLVITRRDSQSVHSGGHTAQVRRPEYLAQGLEAVAAEVHRVGSWRVNSARTSSARPSGMPHGAPPNGRL